MQRQFNYINASAKKIVSPNKQNLDFLCFVNKGKYKFIGSL